MPPSGMSDCTKPILPVSGTLYGLTRWPLSQAAALLAVEMALKKGAVAL